MNEEHFNPGKFFELTGCGEHLLSETIWWLPSKDLAVMYEQAANAGYLIRRQMYSATAYRFSEFGRDFFVMMYRL